MKKIIALSLLVAYFISTVGIICNFHYCEGKIESVKFCLFDKGKCAKGDRMPEGCCKQVARVLRMSENQKTETPFFPKINLLAINLIQNFFTFSITRDDNKSIIADFHSPPPKIPDIRIFVSSFII